MRGRAHLADVLLAAGGCLSWGAYNGRLLLRALHMLQLEQYQTARYLGWSARKLDRWARADRAALALLAGALAVASSRAVDRSSAARVAGWLAYAAIGAWLWRGARFGEAKKPLVLTARAKRLLAGQVTVALGLAAGPAAALWLGGGTARRWTLPALAAGLSGISLTVPPVTAGANLLLWPVEEGFRRYYLADARRRLRRVGPIVVAVSGSYGKTSTKEFTATILGARWPTLKPPDSFNTPMGISRVIREQLQPHHELFVAELGDYVPGDIRFLCDLVSPKIGVFTTIGPEHLERFKTIERVVQTKAELIDALPADGVAVINQDDPLVRSLGERAASRGLRVVRYGQREPGAQVRARDVRTTREGLSFTVEADGHGAAELQVGVLGRHNVANVLAAAAVGLELGMSLDEVAVAARAIAPVEHRLQPIRGAGGVLVIDDAFNANPRGAAEALAVLGELEGGRKVLVTPGMIELAEREHEENRAFGRKAATVCDEVVLVGPERTRPILAGLRDAGFGEERVHVVHTLAEATDRLRGLLGPGDVVLFENDLPDQYDEVGGRQRALGSWQGAGDRGQKDEGGERGTGTLPTAYVPPPTNPDPLPTADCRLPTGQRIAFRATGRGTAGLPVVVLHGWGASSQTVGSIVACLESGHRVVAPDLPGFGASDPPPAVWGSGDFATAIRGLLAQLGIERAHFVGHSRGGAVAIVLAATVPELVERLVLVDSAGIRARRGPAQRARVLAYKSGRRVVEAIPQHAVRTSLRGWLGRRFGSEDYRQASGTVRGTLVRVVNEDLRHLLPRIQAPTLLIWGERDDATPLADGQLMERLIPDAGLVVFPGAGHFAYADDPGRFCRVVSHFLQP